MQELIYIYDLTVPATHSNSFVCLDLSSVLGSQEVLHFGFNDVCSPSNTTLSVQGKDLQMRTIEVAHLGDSFKIRRVDAN